MFSYKTSDGNITLKVIESTPQQHLSKFTTSPAKYCFERRYKKEIIFTVNTFLVTKGE